MSAPGTTAAAAVPAAAEQHSPDRDRIEALAARLYAEHRRYLLGIATRNALNPDDAEEALHETFIAFIRKFDPEGEAPPRAWLTLTLKRECWGRRHREHLDRRAGQEADLANDERMATHSS